MDQVQNSPSTFRELRVARRLTRRRCAVDLGVSVFTVKAWERLKSWPTSDRFPDIGNYFGITTNDARDLFLKTCPRCSIGQTATNCCTACLIARGGATPRRLREAAGYTLVEVGALIDRSGSAVQLWEAGKFRPENWGTICGLAQLYKISPADAAKVFWNEVAGGPCPYHPECTGHLIEPVDPSAMRFDVRTICEICQYPKDYRGKHKSGDHYRICHDCWCRNVNLGWIVVKCGGYTLYGETHYSRGCVKEKQVRVSRFKRYLPAGSGGDFTCRPCSSARSAILTRERTVRNFIEAARKYFCKTEYGSTQFREKSGFPSDKRLPRIQTYKELSRRYNIVRPWQYLDGDKIVRFPCGAAPRTVLKSKEFSRTSRCIGQLVRFAKRGRVRFVKGYCERCGENLISENQVRVHAPCGRYKGRNSLEDPPNTRKDKELQQRRAAWTALQVCGWDTEAIAKHFAESTDTIKKGIQIFRKGMPKDGAKIPLRLRPFVSLLLGKSDRQNSERFWYARGSIDPSFRFPRRSRVPDFPILQHLPQ